MNYAERHKHLRPLLQILARCARGEEFELDTDDILAVNASLQVMSNPDELPHVVEREDENGDWVAVASFASHPTAVWFRDKAIVGGRLEIRGDHRVRSPYEAALRSGEAMDLHEAEADAKGDDHWHG